MGFDGYTFTLFLHDPENDNSLGNNQINDLVKDQEGNIWIATNKGIDCYNPATNRFTRYDLLSFINFKGGSNSIRSIFKNSTGTLWLTGFQPIGLIKINPATKERLLTTHYPIRNR
jgi:streptogramin lyase